MNKVVGLFLRASFILLYAISFLVPTQSASAATTLSVTPITWNVIGLDSNNVNVGPNKFPVAARVCNIGGENATNVTATFNWTSSNSLINNRPGTLTSINLGTLAPAACADAYFEVEVTRDSNAYDTTRSYKIDVTAGNVTGNISTPTPRELYVEHLVSQSRNATTNVEYGPSLASMTSVPAGGTMNFMVGNTYYIRLTDFTATNGYEQLENFINIPNTIFQILSVSTTFTADTSGNVASPYDKLYLDSCLWINDPTSSSYRSCSDVGKAGGNLTVTYLVKVLQVPTAPLVNPEPLGTLVYDFSGSSYHYNSDWSSSIRYANIINASIEKSFSPKLITPGSNSTLTFTINNPGPTSITSVNFTDDLPNNVNLANTNVTYTGCGTPSPTSGSLTDPMSFSNITVAGNSTCTIAVTVTSNTNGTYANTTSTLKLGTTDTLDTGSDTLVVSSAPPPPNSCTTRTEMARWNLTNYTANTSTQNGPFSASSLGTNVSLGTGTYNAINDGTATGSTSGIANTTTFPTGWSAPSATGNSGNSWGIRGAWLASNPATPATAVTPSFQFQVTATGYGGLQITSNYNMQGNWSNSGNWYVLTSTDGTTWTSLNNAAWSKANAWQTGITGTTTSTSNTVYFRIYAAGAQYSGNPSATGATLYLDDVVISGCPTPPVPTISKSFVPTSIGTGSSSTLSLTVNNTASGSSALTGVSFTDVLPGGLVIDTPNSLSSTCTGTVTAAAGTSTISLSGGSLAANSSCTISVSVKGNAAGSYTNTTTNITSTESGPNTSTTPNVGFGQAALTVIDPPVINKSFTANPIFTGNSTTLTLSINNPNAATALTGVGFTDSLPSGLLVSATPALTNTCGGTATATAGSSSVSLSGASLAAGSTCTITVSVTGSTVGLKTNSVTVSSTNGGTGNTSTATVLVKDPAPAISVLKSVGSSNSGPWTPSLNVTLPGNVYYRLIVENVGDLPLNSVNVSDPNVSTASCSWVDGDGTVLGAAPITLPVADAANNQLATCILGPIAAVDGTNPNTATASGTNGTTVTDTSTATYIGNAPNLTLSKTDSVTTVTAGGTTTYTLTVTNAGTVSTSGTITVVDVLPTGMTILDGAVTLGGAQSANWACSATSNVITCTSPTAILPAGTSIFSFPVNVSTSASGTLVNKAKVGGGGDPTNSTAPDGTTTALCTATGTPEGCALDSDLLNALTIDKDTSTPSAVVGGTATYSIVVTNAGSTTLTGAVISDTLPTGFTYASTGTISTTGAGTTRTATNNPTAGSATPSWGTWTIVPGGSVTIPFTVNIGSGVTPGTYDNTASVVTTEITTPVNDDGNVAQDAGTPAGQDPETDEDVTVTALNAPSVTKDFTALNLASGGNTNLTVTIGNTNLVAITLTADLTDTLPTGMTINTAGNTGTCTGVTATAGAGSFTVANGTSIPAGGCTVIVNVTSSTAGAATNTIAAGDLQTNAGNNASPTSDTVNIYVPPTVAKAFNPTSIAVGGTSVMTLTVTNPAGNPGALTGIQLPDSFPAGVALANTTFTFTPAACGTVTNTAGGASAANDTNVRLNVASLAAGASCAVDINVTGSTTGAKLNTTNAVTATGPVALTGGTANDTLTVNAVVTAPSISKAFSPNPINVNDVSTLILTITNPNAGTSLTGVAFTDTFPAGLQVAATPAITTTGCGSPIFAPAAGNTSLSFSGGTIAPAGTCTVTVNVTATTGGSKVNTTGNVTSTNGGTGNTGTDTLQVNVPVDLQVTKTDGVTSFIAGGNLTYTIRLFNAGPNNVTGATLSDVRPVDFSSWSWTCTATGVGSACGTPSNAASGTADISVTGINLPADPTGTNNFLTYTVTAIVDSATTANNITNTVTVTEPAGTLDTDKTNNSASDTDGQIFDPPSAFKTFTAIGGIPVLEFRMVWVNNGNAAAINVQVTDTIPAGTTYVPLSVTCTPTNTAPVPPVPPSSNAAAASAPLNTAGVLPVSSCGYDPATNSIQWQGTIAPDPGVLNDANAEANANNEIVITFQVTVNGGINSVSNVGTSRTDADNNGDFVSQADVLGTTIANSNLVSWSRDGNGGGGPGVRVATVSDPVVLPTLLPATGFAPNRVTILPEQPEELAYRATSVWLEVPRLGLKMPIVGVPLYEKDWDISWLWKEAGWLEGTAFPTWQGNSVLTSHVTLPNGEAGPFASLGKLQWGDRVLVHAYGTVYIYEVRANQVISPNDTSILKHEDDAWLTLLTCKTYIESTNTYSNRIAVRAVLIGTQVDKTPSGKNVR